MEVFLELGAGNLGVETGDFLETALDICPAEAFITDLLGPFIVVVSRSDEPAAIVDGRGTTKPFSARVVDLLAAELLLGSSLVAPIRKGLRFECYLESLIGVEIIFPVILCARLYQ